MHRLVRAAAIALAGCGAAQQTSPIAHVISFGDSLSDVGSYAPIAGPIGGGKFTTNDGPLWIELVARGYGLALTPNVVGWGNQQPPVSCPAAECLAYGQGGSRVTQPNGINNEDGKQAGALTIPVVTQLQNHLKQSGGAFQQTDLIFVLAGPNDVLFQAGVVAAGGSPMTAAMEVAQAATELAGYIKTIFDKGGKYVYVVTVPDFSNTPYGRTLPPQGQQLLTGLVMAFDQTLQGQVAAQKLPVKWVDLAGLLADEQVNPGKYQLTNMAMAPCAAGKFNVTAPACDMDKIKAVTGGQVTTGSSLFCSQATLVAGCADQTFLFADGLHPTTAGHRAFAQVVQGQLRADGLL